MNQPPLNPDALTRHIIIAGQIGAWIDEWDDGKADTAHVATHVANRLAENGITTLAVAQPETQKLTDAEWREFQAIPDQGYSHRAWVDARIAERVAVAQPVVNSVEELDALPVGTVIIDKYGDTGLIDREGTVEKCVQFAETTPLSIGYTAKHCLPARVLYRPEVPGA